MSVASDLKEPLAHESFAIDLWHKETFEEITISVCTKNERFSSFFSSAFIHSLFKDERINILGFAIRRTTEIRSLSQGFIQQKVTYDLICTRRGVLGNPYVLK